MCYQRLEIFSRLSGCYLNFPTDDYDSLVLADCLVACSISGKGEPLAIVTVHCKRQKHSSPQVSTRHDRLQFFSCDSLYYLKNSTGNCASCSSVDAVVASHFLGKGETFFSAGPAHYAAESHTHNPGNSSPNIHIAGGRVTRSIASSQDVNEEILTDREVEVSVFVAVLIGQG